MDGQSFLRTGGRAVELVDYQDAAVVSRMLLKGPAGSVTAFALDVHQELSEHTAPYDALLLILDGEAEVRVAGVSHQLVTGDVLLLPANEPHAVKATKRFKMILTMMRP
ncbi:MAG TPA: cupin domain-containing protein [Dehalococcoidia bacterium]|nr:cupin domain-containing protein [Dehalococcoidia bacterium]